MKLTQEQIDKLEGILTFMENGGSHKATIIKFNLSEVNALSGFKRILRDIDIVPEVGGRWGTRVDPQDRALFEQFLAFKAAQEGSKNG